MQWTGLRGPFPQKIAALGESRQQLSLPASLTTVSYTAFLNVHDILRGIALREDGFFSSKLVYRSAQTGRIEK